MVSPALGGGGPDVLQFEFLGDTTGVVDLSLPPNENYGTCEDCVVVFQDSGPNEVTYFLTQGSIDIDPASVPSNGDVSFTATNIRLVEVTIDDLTFESTPVPGGGCLDLASAGGDFFSVPGTNDTCATALPLIGATGGTWFEAVNDYSPGGAGNPCTGFSANGGDVAYSFTLAAGQTLDVTVTPANFGDASLYVVTDCAQEEGTCQEGVDQGEDGDPETLTFTSPTGGNFFLIVDSFVSSVDEFTISATIN